VSPLVIAHRLGALGPGLETLIAQAAPDVEVVAWPEPGEVLAALDVPWSDDERQLPAETRWVHVLGAGVGNFPLDMLEGRPLTCSKGASAPAIAEFVLATMLAFAKRLPGTWVTEPPPAWNRADLAGLRGRTLGLIGLGAIGTEVARRALAFEMDVVAARRSERPAGIAGVRVAPLGDVLAVADHLVVAAPATAETRHLLDAAAFAVMKPGVHVVNIARGALVDQDALVAALDGGRVAMASLDVVDPEPLPAGHPLYRHPRVRISPHVSWSSPDTVARTLDMFLDNLRRYRAGEQLAGIVDVEAGY
jgi:phosphoglycerate dehydrogenase-like enzyme